MAVRELDGTDDVITLGVGGITTLRNDTACTLLAVVKPTSLADGESFLSVYKSAGGNGVIASLYDGGGGQLAWGTDDPSLDSRVASNLAASSWQVIAVTVPAGSPAQPRLHRKALGSGTWTHANGSNTVTGTTNAAAAIKVGCFISSGFKDYRIACAAIWQGTALSDGTLESIESSASTLAVYNQTPTALWDFNQASTATAVTDLTGGGANETAIVGTTVVTTDDPAWTFGLGTPQTLRPDADTTTTGWTTTPLWSKLNDSSDATVVQATLA